MFWGNKSPPSPGSNKPSMIPAWKQVTRWVISWLEISDYIGSAREKKNGPQYPLARHGTEWNYWALYYYQANQQETSTGVYGALKRGVFAGLGKMPLATCFHAGILLVLFDPEHGGNTFLWNISWLSMDYIALTSQKTVLFMTTTVRTSNPTYWKCQEFMDKQLFCFTTAHLPLWETSGCTRKTFTDIQYKVKQHVSTLILVWQYS
jgi:hypothetical protein